MSATNFYGDNLRLARLIADISLQELGNRVGTTRQYMSQLETNNKKPTADLLEAICYELGVSPGFLYTPLGNLVKQSECHFRKLRSVPVSSVRECTARITLLNVVTEQLGNIVEFPRVNFPNLDYVNSSKDAAQAAEDCREAWGLGKRPIASVSRLIENAGGIVTTFGPVSEKVDALSVHRKRPIVILNSSKNRPRIRFDLAHELGHIVMHQGVESEEGEEGREVEAQADQFASHFLLPQGALLQAYAPRPQVDWNKIRELKRTWGISMRAIIYRLRQAGLITPSQYRTANIHLSKTGQTKSEVDDELVYREAPELLPNALKLVGETYGHSFGGLVDSLGISRELLAKVTDAEDILFSPDIENTTSNVISFQRKPR